VAGDCAGAAWTYFFVCEPAECVFLSWATIPSGTLSYDANGNLTSDGTYTYGWDAEGNLITVSGVTGTFDALGRRLEVDISGTYEQMVYPPFAPTYQMALAEGLTAEGIRMPLPGGGEGIFSNAGAGLAQYRHPNWAGEPGGALVAERVAESEPGRGVHAVWGEVCDLPWRLQRVLCRDAGDSG
jgi:hypothetical protein